MNQPIDKPLPATEREVSTFIDDVLAWLEYRNGRAYRAAARPQRFDPEVEAYTGAIRIVRFAQMDYKPEILAIELKRRRIG